LEISVNDFENKYGDPQVGGLEKPEASCPTQPFLTRGYYKGMTKSNVDSKNHLAASYSPPPPVFESAMFGGMDVLFSLVM
jgi:hypothetical protein